MESIAKLKSELRNLEVMEARMRRLVDPSKVLLSAVKARREEIVAELACKEEVTVRTT